MTANDIDRATAGQTIPRNFLATVASRSDAVALRWTRGGTTSITTYREYADQAARVAGALTVLGVGPGDRVVLLMRNRPEFHVADVGVLLTGATPISIYTSSPPEQIAYLMHHCGASVALVEDAELLAGVLEVRVIYRHHWEGLGDVELVKAACEVLVDAHWLREIDKPTGGRPAGRYQINPLVWK